MSLHGDQTVKCGVAKFATGLEVFAFAQNDGATHKRFRKSTNAGVLKGDRTQESKETAMRKSIATILAAAAIAGSFAAPAVAADETVSVTVAYADLDVADPAGADVLTQRIDTAVEKVCHRPDMRDLKGMVAWEECKSDALAGAMEQLSLVEPYAAIDFASRF
jgi:UrcA family protein